MINIFWLTDHVISSSTKSRRKDLVADKQQSIPFLNIRSLSQMIRRFHTFQQGHGGLIPTAPLPDFRVNPHQLVPEYTQLCNFFKNFFNAPQRDGKRLITFLVRGKKLGAGSRFRQYAGRFRRIPKYISRHATAQIVRVQNAGQIIFPRTRLPANKPRSSSQNLIALKVYP